MVKVLITRSKYQMYEYDYGKTRRTGLPIVTMIITEYATKKEAKAAIKKINDTERSKSVSVEAEII